MVLTDDLIDQGFSLQDVTNEDLDRYLDIKRDCCKKYFDEYYGGWIEDIQVIINTDKFKKLSEASCFKKILLNGSIVGFFGYDEQIDKISEACFNRLIGM